MGKTHFQKLVKSIREMKQIPKGKRKNSIRKIKLTKEEMAIEQSLEEYVPVRGRKLEEIVAAIERKRKEIQKKRINHPSD